VSFGCHHHIFNRGRHFVKPTPKYSVNVSVESVYFRVNLRMTDILSRLFSKLDGNTCSIVIAKLDYNTLFSSCIVLIFNLHAFLLIEHWLYFIIYSIDK